MVLVQRGEHVESATELQIRILLYDRSTTALFTTVHLVP